MGLKLWERDTDSFSTAFRQTGGRELDRGLDGAVSGFAAGDRGG
jgi:hypothetical protein